MKPADLSTESFAQYPLQARAFAHQHLSLLQQLPLALLPLLLSEIQEYDWHFPAERQQLEGQFASLVAMPKGSLERLLDPFHAVLLPLNLDQMDWVAQPQQFTARLTAILWSDGQIDAYHAALRAYEKSVQSAHAQSVPIAPRWTVVVLGGRLTGADATLFRRLVPHGTLFTQVNPAKGWEVLLEEVGSRAEAYQQDYGHWYIDSDVPDRHAHHSLTVSSYALIAPVAQRELELLHRFTVENSAPQRSGVEAVSSYIAGLSPEDLNVKISAQNAALRHFEVALLTQRAGCQIFSTTYVQWAARECLRRAQPLTLLARFGSRQRTAPMNLLLARDPAQQVQDLEGSFVDADIGVYYTWINQSRLPGADQARFLAWHEGGKVALAIGPTLPRGTTSTNAVGISQLVEWLR